GIAELLQVEQKKQTSGFDLWLGCMNGDPKYTAEMEAYNRQDVRSLEQVYERLIPWTTTVNMGLYYDTDELICSKCGSRHVEKRGPKRTKVGLYQAYRCLDCMGYSRARMREKRVGPVLT
ncbi:MAG: hypothetical protein JRJ51_17160, partial [Deltaproteobacteria bacterium]|nr:hypothetical protein [Deltaproteobacteria bacterium]